jgi:hypothetical protein
VALTDRAGRENYGLNRLKRPIVAKGERMFQIILLAMTLTLASTLPGGESSTLTAPVIEETVPELPPGDRDPPGECGGPCTFDVLTGEIHCPCG